MTNPYRHDHNPLNADFHGGICSACEWEADTVAEFEQTYGHTDDCAMVDDFNAACTCQEQGQM